jgi:hypothetical protein
MSLSVAIIFQNGIKGKRAWKPRLHRQNPPMRVKKDIVETFNKTSPVVYQIHFDG